MHRTDGAHTGFRLGVRHRIGVAVVLFAVGASPAAAVTNQDVAALADAIAAAKSAGVDASGHRGLGPVSPWLETPARRSCGWWTLENQATPGGAQHALLCAPVPAARELGGA